MDVHFPHLSTALRMIALITLVPLSSGWSPGSSRINQRSVTNQGLAAIPPEAQFVTSSFLGYKYNDYQLTTTKNRFHMNVRDKAVIADFTLAGAEVRMGDLLAIDQWIEQGKLTASDGAERDVFGSAVAVSGDTIVVGAVGDDAEQGSAYVFVKPAIGWANMTEAAKLTASDGAALDWFGYSVAVDGDTIVVGAPGGPTGPSTIPGSAYIFIKPPGGWVDMTQTAKLTASDGAIDDRFRHLGSNQRGYGSCRGRFRRYEH